MRRGVAAPAGRLADRGAVTAMVDAWPFLIGRTRTEDHRIVVIPGFMTGPGRAGALRSGTDGAPTPAGTALLRELRVPGDDPVTVVYRIVMPETADYGVSGTGGLTDRQGRPIVLTEGLVLPGPQTDVAGLHLTPEHLDQARRLVAPAYQAFWADGRPFRRESSAPFSLAPASGPELVLDAAPPWQPLTHLDLAGDQVRRAPAVTRPARRPHQAGTWLVSGAVIALAGLAAAWVTGAFRDDPAPATTPTAAMNQLCGTLEKGQAGQGYALTTAAYQQKTPERSFAAELAPGTVSAQCSYAVQAAAGTRSARATMIVTRKGTKATTWTVALAQEGGGWQIAGLSRR